jgi:hypothetical protein
MLAWRMMILGVEVGVPIGFGVIAPACQSADVACLVVSSRRFRLSAIGC